MSYQPYVITRDDPNPTYFAIVKWIIYILIATTFLSGITKIFKTGVTEASLGWLAFLILAAVVGGIYRRERAKRLSRIRRQVRFAVIEHLPHLAQQRIRLLSIDSSGHVKADEWAPYIPAFLKENVSPRLDKKEAGLFENKLRDEVQYVEDCVANALSGRPLEAGAQ